MMTTDAEVVMFILIIKDYDKQNYKVTYNIQI